LEEDSTVKESVISKIQETIGSTKDYWSLPPGNELPESTQDAHLCTCRCRHADMHVKNDNEAYNESVSFEDYHDFDYLDESMQTLISARSKSNFYRIHWQ
jgi:hypothetical protein